MLKNLSFPPTLKTKNNTQKAKIMRLGHRAAENGEAKACVWGAIDVVIIWNYNSTMSQTNLIWKPEIANQNFEILRARRL